MGPLSDVDPVGGEPVGEEPVGLAVDVAAIRVAGGA